jgi:hypothetical protein
MGVFSAERAWGHYDLKASWVAIFLLLILWWLSLIPLMFEKGADTTKEEGVTTTSPVDDDHTDRFQRVARHFRDGLLFLLASITITVIAAGPVGTTNALAWVFTSFWIIIGGLMLLFKWRRLLTLLSFLDLVLLIALVSDAFAHPSVRSRVIAPP